MKNTKLFLLIILTVLSASAAWAQLEMSSHEALLALAAVGIFFLLKAASDRISRRSYIAGTILGAVFALCSVLGKLDAQSEAKNYILWTAVRFAGLWVLFAAGLSVLFEKLSSVSLADTASDRSAKKCKRVFFASFACLLIVYSLWWLYEFPGNTSPDSSNQIMQAMGLIPLSNHHPVANTMFLKLIFNIGFKLFDGNQNVALGLYTFVQLIFMSACFAYTVAVLYREGIKRTAIIAVLALYLFLPYHASYSVTVWKDVPFGGMVLLLCTTLWQLLERSKQGEKTGAGLLSLFAFSAFGVCLLRSNGLYAFVLTLPFIIIVFRKQNIKITVIAAGTAAASILITGVVYPSLNIRPADFVESLSIPAQQIARVIASDGELTGEQEELLSRIIDISAVKDTYNENISDPIKNLIRTTGDVEYLSAHKGEYLKLWVNIGMSHPGDYLRGFIEQTKGYWYPDVKYWSMSTYCDDCIQLEIYKDRHLPDSIGRIFADVGFYSPNLPIVGSFFSIGLAAWVLLSMFSLCIVNRKYALTVIYIPVIAVLATLLIATPVYAEFRYAYSLFTTLPLLCVIPFIPLGNH
ncbi:MAG: DUF6020 family protein [Eubacteriales bacterium]|nr:DUF6020 family protein [Eubacteriales bacterium]